LTKPPQPETPALPLEDVVRVELAKILALHPVALAYLFGSAATGLTTPFSLGDFDTYVQQSWRSYSAGLPA
jgi:predicted nucleotidyltransferase